MLPFRAGIEAGAPLVMAAHIAAPAVTCSDLPATLSPVILHDKLRGELGFRGIIITDALEMGAITQLWGSGEAAVRALEAGADCLLCPLDYCEAFEGVLAAVESGRLSEGRIEQSLRRLFALRAQLSKEGTSGAPAGFATTPTGRSAKGPSRRKVRLRASPRRGSRRK